jgi:hypothetical protein
MITGVADSIGSIQPLVSDRRGRFHPVSLVTLGDRSDYVDVELALLVLELWRAGLSTDICCQDLGEFFGAVADGDPQGLLLAERHLGRAVVVLPWPGDLFTMYDIVASNGPRDEFFDRMVDWSKPGAWVRAVGVIDEYTGDDERRPPEFGCYGIAWTFPRSDITEVASRLQRHNDSKI